MTTTTDLKTMTILEVSTSKPENKFPRVSYAFCCPPLPSSLCIHSPMTCHITIAASHCHFVCHISTAATNNRCTPSTLLYTILPRMMPPLPPFHVAPMPSPMYYITNDNNKDNTIATILILSHVTSPITIPPPCTILVQQPTHVQKYPPFWKPTLCFIRKWHCLFVK